MEDPFKKEKPVLPYLQKRRLFKEEAAYISDHGLDKYKKSLGINIAEMKGKLVLDFGSGANEKFSKEASKKGIRVVSMSPHLKNKDELGTLFFENWQNRSVAGRGQEIPFADNTFDYEVAQYSVPYYLPFAHGEYKRFFNEVIRTLKPGGKAYFFPIFFNDTDGYSVSPEFISKLLNKYSDYITYTIEKINAEDKECRLILTKNKNKDN